MDIIVSILSLITGTDDVGNSNTLPECWQGGIVRECVSTTDTGTPYMIDADGKVALIYWV